MQKYHFAFEINMLSIEHIMDYFLEYHPDVSKKVPSFEELVSFTKLIPPLCIIGELDEDPYDDPDDFEDDISLPRV